MGRPAKYPEEFRRDAVELCRSSGRPIADVARSLGITDSTLHNWLKADREARQRAADPDALTESERDELARLRKENIELRTDKEILRSEAPRDSWRLSQSGAGNEPKAGAGHGSRGSTVVSSSTPRTPASE